MQPGFPPPTHPAAVPTIVGLKTYNQAATSCETLRPLASSNCPFCMPVIPELLNAAASNCPPVKLATRLSRSFPVDPGVMFWHDRLKLPACPVVVKEQARTIFLLFSSWFRQ